MGSALMMWYVVNSACIRMRTCDKIAMRVCNFLQDVNFMDDLNCIFIVVHFICVMIL